MALLYELLATEANRLWKPQRSYRGTAGIASHSEYVTGQLPAGGPVNTCASLEVRSKTTCRGATPSIATDDRVGPSTTGRRPICSIESTACSSTAAEVDTTNAV